ncbi:unnamed protein product, partial [Meganyctiphanes norvegica]
MDAGERYASTNATESLPPQAGDGNSRSAANHSNYPWWVEEVARPYVFPMCLFMSAASLLLVVSVHAVVPELRQKGGLYLFCHHIALMIKAVVAMISLAVDIPHRPCKLLAVGIYYLTICTFVWLRIMCFEAWRNIR